MVSRLYLQCEEELLKLAVTWYKTILTRMFFSRNTKVIEEVI